MIPCTATLEGEKGNGGAKKNSADLEKIINHDRYVLESSIQLGRGSWGVVYPGRDLITDEPVAIKIIDPGEVAQLQMQERNIDSVKATRKEALRLAPCAHVVPRQLEIDKNGMPFIVMPRYEKILADILNDDGERNMIRKGISVTDVHNYIKCIGLGISESHNILKRVHGDVKPDNIPIDKRGNLLLNDFGSSTCTSIGRSVSPRDNIGFVYTRAPEQFKKGSHPEEQSDIWAWGSLIYRFYTGKYALEDELNQAKDPVLFFEQLGEKGVNAVLSEKIKKNIPKKLRKMLEKALNADPNQRYATIDDALKDFDKAIKPGFIASHPVIASSIAASLIGLVAAGSWLGYNMFAKDGTIKSMITAVEEGKKYKVGSQWDTDSLEITNNLFQLKFNDAKSKLDFPSYNFLQLTPGERRSITVTAKEIARAKEGLLDFTTSPPLKGKIYILGFPSEDFRIQPGSYKTSSGDNMGMIGAAWTKYDVPRDIPEGNYILVVEVYAPDKDEIPTAENYKGIRFNDPGRALSRIPVPVVVGNVKSKFNLDSLFIDYISPLHVSMGSIEKKNQYDTKKIMDASLEISVPEEHVKEEISGSDNLVYGLRGSVWLPNKVTPGPRTLQVLARDNAGRIVASSWTSLAYVHAFSNNETGEKFYQWQLDLPDRDFWKRAMRCRQKAFSGSSGGAE